VYPRTCLTWPYYCGILELISAAEIKVRNYLCQGASFLYFVQITVLSTCSYFLSLIVSLRTTLSTMGITAFNMSDDKLRIWRLWVCTPSYSVILETKVSPGLLRTWARSGKSRCLVLRNWERGSVSLLTFLVLSAIPRETIYIFCHVRCNVPGELSIILHLNMLLPRPRGIFGVCCLNLLQEGCGIVLV